MKLVFDYDKFSEFLQDYSESMKSSKKHWSLSSWAKELDLSSTASLTNIIQGRRIPSLEMTQKIADSIADFSNLERNYFLLLIDHARNEGNLQLQDSIKKRMASIKPNKGFKQLSAEHLSKISTWHAYAIREMVNLAGATPDPEWFAKRLGESVPLEEVKRSIQCLLEVGLLKFDQNQNLAISEERFETSTDVSSKLLRDYHKSVLNKAIESIDNCPLEKRHLNACTLSIRMSDLPAAKLFIENARREFSDLFDKQAADEVYQLNIQFFPLTRTI